MDPLILTALFDDALQARLEADRQAHFPAERNMIPAHLTLFHALPSAAEELVQGTVAEAAATTPPCAAKVTGLMKLGRGWAWRIDAPGLKALHRRLRAAFDADLTDQDRQGLHPHVTVQNKAGAEAAARAGDALRAGPPPPDGVVRALALWHYRGGPWERAAEFDLTGESG